MNIAHRIRTQALNLPDKKAVVFGSSSYTFSEFEERSNQMANYFVSIGITKGTRTLLFVKPCLDFSVITFALFKVGAIPVLIDPGMGIKNLLKSVAQVKPEAMIAISIVHKIRTFIRAPFATVKIKLSPEQIASDMGVFPKTFEPVTVTMEDFSAILFTSGGTGIPKGVEYTHGILNAQTEILQKLFSLTPNDTDLPGFPLFALFTLAMGMTSVIPDMDPTKPAQCDPAKLVKNILTHQVTFCAGSPAIWERVGQYCVKNNIQLGSVKYIVMFGAPVRAEIHQLFRKVLPKGDTYTPYGATECLPVSLISGKEVLNKTAALTDRGAGVCIGHAVPNAEIKIINISDIPETSLSELSPGTPGEIVVKGPMATPSYFELPEETRKAKIHSDGKLWHRMGDIGYIDQEKRLWFLGRKAHRVPIKEQTLWPIEIEAIFNQHAEVKRSALVRFNDTPGLVIERRDGNMNMSPRFFSELLELGKSHERSQLIRDFWLSSALPVDIRHNIKIDRTKLSAMVTEGPSLCRKNLSRRWHASST
ncbi:MAG: fatty acid CoA ligase family protein [Bacteriovoracaceae bacterium]